MDENIINKLELKLGDATISLTIEQARKLKDALGELFGKDVVKEIHHHDYYPYRWYWPWPSGTYVWPTHTVSGITTQPELCSHNASYESSSGILSLKVA